MGDWLSDGVVCDFEIRDGIDSLLARLRLDFELGRPSCRLVEREPATAEDAEDGAVASDVFIRSRGVDKAEAFVEGVEGCV